MSDSPISVSTGPFFVPTTNVNIWIQTECKKCNTQDNLYAKSHEMASSEKPASKTIFECPKCKAQIEIQITVLA